MKITGTAAIGYANQHGTTLHKYADPTEGSREVTLSEARAIAAEDPSLLYTRAEAWTFEGYWNTVFGACVDAAQVVAEYDLEPGSREGFSEWVGASEWEAWKAGGLGDVAAMQAAWGEFHDRAVGELMSAADFAK